MANLEDNINKSSATDCIAVWDSWGHSAKWGKKKERAKGIQVRLQRRKKVGGCTAKDILHCSRWSMLEITDIFRVDSLQECFILSPISVQISAWHQWEILFLSLSAWGTSVKRTLPITSQCQSLSKWALLCLEIVLFLSIHFSPPYWYNSLMTANFSRPALKAPALLFLTQKDHRQQWWSLSLLFR